MSNHDTVVGTVVRDAHNSFWIMLSPTKFLPVDVDTHKWLTANTPERPVMCATCRAGMQTAV